MTEKEIQEVLEKLGSKVSILAEENRIYKNRDNTGKQLINLLGEYIDEDDWNKITRVIRYLKHSSKLLLTLEANSMNVMKWWVDEAYTVHDNCRSHTGATATLGSGSIYNS